MWPRNRPPPNLPMISLYSPEISSRRASSHLVLSTCATQNSTTSLISCNTSLCRMLLRACCWKRLWLVYEVQAEGVFLHEDVFEASVLHLGDELK